MGFEPEILHQIYRLNSIVNLGGRESNDARALKLCASVCHMDEQHWRREGCWHTQKKAIMLKFKSSRAVCLVCWLMVLYCWAVFASREIRHRFLDLFLASKVNRVSIPCGRRVE